VSENKIVLRPLIGLLEDQPSSEIERYVMQEIERHRRLRDDALMLESRVDPVADATEERQASRAYISAMIAVHAQQTVVSTLLDILGYIPDMPKTKVH